MSILNELNARTRDEAVRESAGIMVERIYGTAGWWMIGGILSFLSIYLGGLCLVVAVMFTASLYYGQGSSLGARVTGLLPRAVDAVLNMGILRWFLRHKIIFALFLLFWVAPAVLLGLVSMAGMAEYFSNGAVWIAISWIAGFGGLGIGFYIFRNARSQAWVSLTK